MTINEHQMICSCGRAHFPSQACSCIMCSFFRLFYPINLSILAFIRLILVSPCWVCVHSDIQSSYRDIESNSNYSICSILLSSEFMHYERHYSIPFDLLSIISEYIPQNRYINSKNRLRSTACQLFN